MAQVDPLEGQGYDPAPHVLADEADAAQEAPQTVTMTRGDVERLEVFLDDLARPVAAYAATLTGERDAYAVALTDMTDTANRLAKALADLVDAYPVTSWGASNDAHDAAKALLDELGGERGTISSPEQTPTAGA